jgi:hypothetical protein
MGNLLTWRQAVLALIAVTLIVSAWYGLPGMPLGFVDAGFRVGAALGALTALVTLLWRRDR